MTSFKITRTGSLFLALLSLMTFPNVALAQNAQASDGNPLSGDGARLQVGPGGFDRVNSEFPLINYMAMNKGNWYVDKVRGESYPASKIDQDTGFPTELIDGKRAVSDWMFDAFDAERMAGTWVLELEGEGRININKGDVPAMKVRRISDKRIEFERTVSGRLGTS